MLRSSQPAKSALLAETHVTTLAGDDLEAPEVFDIHGACLSRGSQAQVDDRRRQNEERARPVVRSEWLSKYGGLGYQQAQIGDTVFACIRYDADDALLRLLSPSTWRFRMFVPGVVGAVLLLVRLVASLLSYSEGSEVGGGGSSFWLISFLLVGAAAVTAAFMPDSGITPSYRDEWDRTGLHLACLLGSHRCAAALLALAEAEPGGLHGGALGTGKLAASFVDCEDWALATPLHLAGCTALLIDWALCHPLLECLFCTAHSSLAPAPCSCARQRRRAGWACAPFCWDRLAGRAPAAS